MKTMEQKFILTDEFVINVFGVKLFRIKCIQSFKYANEGELGGFIEKEGNLEQSGDAWVYGDAQVYGNARVYGDAKIENNDSHCGFDCFGSVNRHTHAYLTKDNKVEITCGCFNGSIEEFEKKWRKPIQGLCMINSTKQL